MNKTINQSLLALNQQPINKLPSSGEVSIRVINGQPLFSVTPLEKLNDRLSPSRRHKSVWSGLAVALVIWLAPTISQAVTYDAAAVIKSCNTARQENGAAKLTANELLNRAAQLKAHDMLNQEYFGHTSPDGVTPWDWLAEVDYSFTEAGENLAQDFVDAQDIIDAWLGSDSHRRNLLATKFNDIGAAVASGEMNGQSTIIVVVFFGSQRATVTAPVVENTPIPTPAAPTSTVTPDPTPIASAPVPTTPIIQPEPVGISSTPEFLVPSLTAPDGVTVPNLAFTLIDPGQQYLGMPVPNPRVEGAQTRFTGTSTVSPKADLSNLPSLILAVCGLQFLMVLVFGMVQNWYFILPKTSPVSG